MNEFENKIYERIHYSRFIASWINQGGKFDRKGQIQFGDWLDTLTINGKAIPECPKKGKHLYGHVFEPTNSSSGHSYDIAKNLSKIYWVK